MSTLFNLVCTNSLDGDHATLQRWYADHVHLLLRFDGLRGAHLLAREDVAPGLTAASTACHYLCLYAFESPEAFAEFEVSSVRKSAPQLGNAAWMKTGIHIAARQQYQRVTYRANAVNNADAPWQAQSFRLPDSGDALATERWLQGGIHAALALPGCVAVHLLRCTQAPEGFADYLALLQTSSNQALPELTALSAAHQASLGLGNAPGPSESLWQARYGTVGTLNR